MKDACLWHSAAASAPHVRLLIQACLQGFVPVIACAAVYEMLYIMRPTVSSRYIFTNLSEILLSEQQNVSIHALEFCTTPSWFRVFLPYICGFTRAST